MGYFSNSTEGDMYAAEFCDHCVHFHPVHGCPCVEAHLLWNYEEANNKDSILHRMIPRERVEVSVQDVRCPGKTMSVLANAQCIFFVRKSSEGE